MIVTSSLLCLALNIYHEARGEPLAGQLAIAEVTLNRVASSKFPDNVCDVVKQAKYYQGKPIRNKCQFSWYCDGKPDTPLNSAAWEKALLVANAAYKQRSFRFTKGALYYHSTKVKPFWSKSFNKTIQINNHIFYN